MLRTGRLIVVAALIGGAGCNDAVEQPLQPTSAAPDAALGDPFSAGLELVADGLTSPVSLQSVPDGSGRRFVVDQAGMIRIIDPSGALKEEPFLDLRSKIVPLSPRYDERGLLGLAFDPNFSQNGFFFVYYSTPLRAGAPAGFNHTAVISRFHVSAGDPDHADPGSEMMVLQVDEPQANHNGGTLAFGPDGFLYISLGDGGNANDMGLGHVQDWYADNGGGNGQDITQNLLGNILRIDVSHGLPYRIPADNPFVNGDGLDEIYAYGFRNPAQMSFDMGGSHDLMVADAGQNRWEEVSMVTRGGNYGWNVKEGTHCFDAESPFADAPSCPSVDPTTGIALTDPVIEFANANQGGIAAVVIGGRVYRGRGLPQFSGRYIFGGWSRSFTSADGTLLVATPRKQGLWQLQEINLTTQPDGHLGQFLLGIGQDAEGEVYVLTTSHSGPSGNTGRVYKLIRPSGKEARKG